MNRQRLVMLVITALIPLTLVAEEFEVIPKVEKEDMQTIKEAFGKSVRESRIQDEKVRERKDNFGAKASAEAHKLRDQADRSGGIGQWASKNNPGADNRASDPGAGGLSKAAAARESAPGGGKPENLPSSPTSPGKSHHPRR